MKIAKSKKKAGKLRKILLYILGLLIILLSLLFVYYKGYIKNFDLIDKITGSTSKKNNKNELSMKINAYIDFEDSLSYGVADIQNKKENIYSFKVEIVLADTAEKVYESSMLKPGEKIEKIKLAKRLSKGSYKAIAYFKAYEGKKYIGKSGVELKLNIKG